MIRKFLALTLLCAAPLAMARAQAADPKQVISIQPLMAVFGLFSGEYERAVSNGVTLGVGANRWGSGEGSDEFDYTSAEVKLRFYPERRALRGFSVGGAVGITSVKGASGSGGTRRTVSGPSVGVFLEYQWLLGEKKDFSMVLGLGAKALSISEDDFSSDFIAKYPTMRISVGWAF